MAKIPNHKVDEILIDADYWDHSWWEYQNDWDYQDDIDDLIMSRESEASWQWLMESSIRRSEGWHLYLAPKYSDFKEITSWLVDNNVQFKSERNQFLIKDEQWFTALALLWG